MDKYSENTKTQVSKENGESSEIIPDREENPSADWIQQSNEETIIYSQAGKPETLIQKDNISGDANENMRPENENAGARKI